MTSNQLRNSQATAREKLKRVKVIHRTVVITEDNGLRIKKTLAGPYQYNFAGKQTKAEKKAERRSGHVKRYYCCQRIANRLADGWAVQSSDLTMLKI